MLSRAGGDERLGADRFGEVPVGELGGEFLAKVVLEARAGGLVTKLRG